MSKNVPKLRHEQHGLALLIFAILISLVSITIYFKSLSVTDIKNEQIKSNNKVLSEAKKSLLAYAIMYVDDTDNDHKGEYGFLPCPDVNDNGTIPEGGSHGSCGATGVSTIGLFPWASLETGLMKTGSGSCLWYIVSGDYKSGPKTKMLNEDTNGLFRLFRQYDDNGDGILDEILIAGDQPQDRPIALIINPGRPLDGQLREYSSDSACGLDYAATHFLEGNGNIDNAMLTGDTDTIDDFITAETDSDQLDPPFNDRIVYITRDELWQAVLDRSDFTEKMQNLTNALALCIAEYGNNSVNRRLPRPAPVDLGGADYRDDVSYNDEAAVTYLGRFPYTVDDSDTALGTYPNPAPPPLNLDNAPATGTSTLFDKGFCDALDIGGGVTVNLNTGMNSEYYRLWENWKDHFFLVVSAYYAPTNAGIGAAPNCTGANCIVVGGTEYAAAVIYSSSRTGAQVRNAPISGDADTKKILSNYLEVNNPSGTGTGNYTPTENDIVFCITDTEPLTVENCL
jgi:hypothetical protein